MVLPTTSNQGAIFDLSICPTFHSQSPSYPLVSTSNITPSSVKPNIIADLHDCANLLTPEYPLLPSDNLFSTPGREILLKCKAGYVITVLKAFCDPLVPLRAVGRMGLQGKTALCLLEMGSWESVGRSVRAPGAEAHRGGRRTCNQSSCCLN